ncbi:hypothetical protein BG015_005245 [Linnemannia schmuckeri]|uniref:Kazal-like domain-containing protein n=1 Tax=Linnemannia schmuckeri TaxID=64567 RepID=A0A9P5VCP1_9FUNG|nr:hypothetical protein BG015_005245 [Linnemannia schmuckeri]
MRSSALTLLTIVFSMGILSANASPVPATDILPSDKCPMRCSWLYQPVCGENKAGKQQTFTNECLLKTHNCSFPYDQYKLVHEGKCMGQ